MKKKVSAVLHRHYRHDRQQPHILSCDHRKHHSDSHHNCDPEYFPHGVGRKNHFNPPEQDRCIEKPFIDIVPVIIGKCLHQNVDCKICIKRDNADFFNVSIFKKCSYRVHMLSLKIPFFFAGHLYARINRYFYNNTKKCSRHSSLGNLPLKLLYRRSIGEIPFLGICHIRLI